MADNTIKVDKLTEKQSLELTDLIAVSDSNGVLYRKNLDKLQTFLNSIGVSAYKGMVTPNVGGIPQKNGSDITENGFYIVSQNGDYGTFTNLNISDTLIVLGVENISTTPVYSKTEIPITLTIDATPTEGSTNAVQSGGTADKIEEVTNQKTGFLPLITGFIDTNKNVGEAVDLTRTSSIFVSSVIVENIAQNDKILIKALGGNTSRLWAFLDSSNNLVSKSAENLNHYTNNLVLVVPSGVDKLVINANVATYPLSEVLKIKQVDNYLDEKINEANESISNQSAEIQGVDNDLQNYKTTNNQALVDEAAARNQQVSTILDDAKGKVALTTGGITTNVGVGNVVDLTPSNDVNAKHAVIDATNINRIYVAARGGISVRLLTWLNASNEIIETTEEDLDVSANPVVFKKPQGAVKAVVNNVVLTHPNGYFLVYSEKENRIEDNLEEKFNQDSFTEIITLGNKLSNSYETGIADYRNEVNVSNVIHGIDNNQFRFRATHDYSFSNSFAWTGFSISNSLFTTAKTYVIVAKGTITTTNAKEFSLNPDNNLIIANLQDGIETPFEVVIEVPYAINENTNRRNIYFFTRQNDENIDTVEYDLKLDVFAVFEKVDNFVFADYEAILGKKLNANTIAKKAGYANKAGSADSATNSENATRADVADGLTSLDGLFPSDSFDVIKPVANKVTETLADGITNYHRFDGATGNTTSEVIDGKFVVEATADYNNPPVYIWNGVQMNTPLYATEDKTYVFLLKGTVTTVNGRNLLFGGQIISQDLVDNTPRNFEAIVETTYLAGQDNSTKVRVATVSRNDENISTVYQKIEFDIFAVFEKVEGFSINDYKAAVAGNLIIPKVLPVGTAKESYVDQQVSQALSSVAKLTPNDLIANYDIIMLLIGGQSVALGGGASLSGEDFKNVLSFAGGSSTFGATSVDTVVNPQLSAFANQGEKDAFYGNDFVLLEDNHSNEGYPPITTTMIGLMDLIQKENQVDVENFGLQFFPYAWGRSGAGMEHLEKGSEAYAEMLEAVQKVKDFADKNGKTMAVLGQHWVKGEAEGNNTVAQNKTIYQTLFNNQNTDIKAITGQTEDLHFFLNQPSPWIGIDSGSGVRTTITPQQAIIELVKENANYHFAGAMYQNTYADVLHPADRANVGTTAILPMKRVLLDGATWNNFVPISHKVIQGDGKWFTQLKFNPPVKPARFNTSGTIYENPNGKQPNFGFKIWNNSDVDVLNAEPWIVRGDTIVLETLVNPTGMTIRYAENGQLGGGNLCDSETYVLRNKGNDYPCINWAAGFIDYLID